MGDPTMECPCCDGSGKSSLFRTIGCMWCKATGQVTPADAIRYANQREGLTEGGMLYGEYSVEELFAERHICEGIRKQARALAGAGNG